MLDREELRLARLLVLASHNTVNHKLYYSQYWPYIGQYVDWMIGTAFIRPEGVAKLEELKRKCLTTKSSLA